MIDYEYIVKSAYGATKLYFGGYPYKEEYLCPDPGSNDVGFDMDAFKEEDMAEKLEIFNNGFLRFDAEYIRLRDEYIAELEIWYENYAAAKTAA